MFGKFWRSVLIGLLLASSTVFAENPAGLDDNV